MNVEQKARRLVATAYAKNALNHSYCSLCGEQDPVCLNWYDKGMNLISLNKAARQSRSVAVVKAAMQDTFVLCGDCARGRGLGEAESNEAKRRNFPKTVQGRMPDAPISGNLIEFMEFGGMTEEELVQDVEKLLGMEPNLKSANLLAAGPEGLREAVRLATL